MPRILAVPEGSTVAEDKSQLQHRVQTRSNQSVSPSVGLKVSQPAVETAVVSFIVHQLTKSEQNIVSLFLIHEVINLVIV